MSAIFLVVEMRWIFSMVRTNVNPSQIEKRDSGRPEEIQPL